MGPIYATEDALNYRNEWVAFTPDLQHVVGHGATPGEAKEMADAANELDALLVFVPDADAPTIIL